MTPLLQLEHVSVNVAGRAALHDLCWTLAKGDVWAITGPNGAGKSTFFRLVRGDLWPTLGERTYTLNGVPTRSPLQARERFALVSPELSDWYARSDWTLSGEQVVQSGLSGSALPPFPLQDGQQERARSAIDRLNLAHLAQRDIRSLSTGQRRQVLLARALAGEPQVLLLDEFWEGVDRASHIRLRELVDDLAGQGLTVLYSTHRREEFLASTTHHLQLVGGSATCSGPVRAHQERAVPRRAPAPSPTGELLVEIEEADVYLNDVRVLREVNWHLRTHEHWALVGPNGAGKSSLARLIAGEVHPAVGARVRRFGLSPRATLTERRRLIGLISAEEQARHKRDVSGATVVASGFFGSVGVAGALTETQQQVLAGITNRLDLTPLLERPALELSHGQLKKLLFARALAAQPRLLLLDEPFDYLDDAFKARLMEEFERLARLDTQFVFVVHRLADLPPFVTHAAHLEVGSIVQQGPLGTVSLPSLLS
ncbi:ATP-binding cassette domain-containing protein [Deinococcus peraridilitoris]|uniref:ABC-type molybdenum transport system, ATPase component/photorepair protein PhrA n=1 Tax=Deinococcus peraridilitoris (strain DSM 19664 / LMG 22246 / CIP 109416 / KR-200) TaxID=937777 RepID=L0A6P0_DEIPD|nr:ATP-binding cassette domain-containing protein [Deinococcus peraridilitoris]AFZ68685.1 ABC-type molybdenum transport system, ATPase component/photorepair protein PhrA [Deinococcus peraridilitoris DSM 19664]